MRAPRAILAGLLAGLTVPFAAGAQTAEPAAGVAIESPGPEGPLAGTYLDAGKGSPVVLIVPGSGAINRDGGVPQSYRLLAEALAARGISTVRIDKRGMFGSKAAVADANSATIAAYADDVHGWARTIRARTGAPCIWVAGHSEGALVALKAVQAPADLCGLVLLAGAGRPVAELIPEQLRGAGLPEGDLKAADTILAALKAGKHVEANTIPPVLMPLFRPAVQAYLIDFLFQDPAKLAAAYRGPMLIVRGTRDIQVAQADADALHAARPDAPVLLPEGMTHTLKHVDSDDRAANLKSYADPTMPLQAGLADAIAAFLRQHPSR